MYILPNRGNTSMDEKSNSPPSRGAAGQYFYNPYSFH